jgi:hypothetical protein
VLLVAHVVTVVVAFGALLSLPVLSRLVREHSEMGSAAARWGAIVVRFRRRLVEPAFGLIGLLGAALVVANPDPDLWRVRWVEWAAGLYLVAAVAILGVQAPMLRRIPRLVERLSSETPSADETEPTASNETRIGRQPMTPDARNPDAGNPEAGKPEARSRVAKELKRATSVAELVSAVSAVGLVVMVTLMITKPG